MAHPRRAAFVEEMLEALDVEPTVVWDERNDRWDTGRRSWLAYDPDATHHAVIQDDALVCEDFAAGLTEALEHTGNHPVGLYFGRNSPDSFTNNMIAYAAGTSYSWIRTEGPIWGVGMCLPTEDIEAMIERCDEKRGVKNYDTRIHHWYRSQGRDALYTWPSLVDHRDVSENPSLVPGRTSAGRVAHRFCEGSALDIDWTLPIFDVSKESLIAKGLPMFTFRNISTGEVKTLAPDDSRINRLMRLTHRWELIGEPEPADIGTAQGVSLDQNIPSVLAAVGSDAQLAQSVMEDEAARDNPRSSLLEALAAIVAAEEE